MDPMLLRDISPESPIRRPDWRWLVAEHYAQTKRRLPRRWHDEWTAKAKQFLLRWSHNESQRARNRLIDRLPDIYAAYTLHTSSPHNLRYELEARLLADQSYDAIGHRMAMSAQAIEAYANLFFDIRPRLQAASYVLHVVIGHKLYNGLTEQDVDVLWKLFGYFGGPIVLDAVLEGFAELDHPERLADVTEFFAAHAQADVLRKVVIATKTLQPTGKDVLPLVRLATQLLERLPNMPATRGAMPSPIVDSTQLVSLTPRQAAIGVDANDPDNRPARTSLEPAKALHASAGASTRRRIA